MAAWAPLGTLGIAFLIAVLLAAPPTGYAPATGVAPAGAGPHALAHSDPEAGTSLPHPPSGYVNPPPRWWNVSSGLSAFAGYSGFPTEPPPATGGSIARDPGVAGAGIDVYFGGCAVTRCPENDTWIYFSGSGQPGHWENATAPSDSPPAVEGASLAYDPRIPGFVLFGGMEVSGSLSNETWIYNDTARVWTNATTTACRTSCPTSRFDASMAFAGDAPDRTTLLFGGCADNSCVGRLSDTFELVPDTPGFSWSLVLAPLAPSPRFDAGMAYDGDALANETVLFGGCGGFVADACGLNDTWTFAGGNWTNSTSAFRSINGSSPGGRGHGGLSFDPLDNVTLLVGGGNSTNRFLDDNWQIACHPGIHPCRWVNATDTTYGLPVLDAAILPEAYGSDPLVVGGLSIFGRSSDSTWVFEPAPLVTADDRFSPPFLNGSFRGSVGVGQSVQFFSSVIGGRPNNSDWSLWRFTRGGGLVLDRLGNITYTFEQTGQWWVNATVADVNDLSFSFAFTVLVIGPEVAPVATPTATDVGLPVNLHAVTGGFDVAVPLKFRWDLGDGTTAAIQNLTHVFASPGTFRVAVSLTDNLSNNASGMVNITVEPPPTVSVSLSSTTIAAGAYEDFASTVSNGTAPFTYDWSFGDGSSAAGAALAHAYTKPGSYAANLTVYDSVGVGAFWQAFILVGSPIPLAAVVRANLSSALIGEPIGFYATASGGFAPYTYSWRFGDGTGDSNGSVVHAFLTNGTYDVHLWVNDSNGHSIPRTVTVRIGPPGNVGPSPFASPPALLGVAAALAALALVVLVLWRRRPPPSVPAGPPEPVYPERTEDDPSASSDAEVDRR